MDTAEFVTLVDRWETEGVKRVALIIGGSDGHTPATRAAVDDTLRLMREEDAGKAGGVLHCFTESLEMARAAIDMGFHISFSGIVTFKNARDLKEVARVLPLDRILVETDSPYLAPVPHRGKVNQPALVKHVAEEVARLRGDSFENIARATSENFFRLFPLARPVNAVV